jgi:sulfate-transporting ATPase
VTTILQFVLLGLGPGAIYALAGCGIVLIHRGSGVLNFAHGAQALLGAQILVVLWLDHSWPLGLAMATAVMLSAVGGAVIYLVAMSRLQESSPVVRIIATVGLLAVIQQAVVLGFGTDLRQVPNYLPDGVWQPVEGAGVGYDRLTLLAVAVALSVGLAWVMRSTAFGRATAAIADNRLAAAALGHSPHHVAAWNWVLGSALAGLAGALVVPISGLGVTPLTLLVVPGLAAALLGRFTSFLGTLAGALLLGIGQSLLTRYVRTPGGGDAFVFLMIIAVTVARGRAIPSRDEVTAQLPRVGRSGIRLRWLLAGAGLCVLPAFVSARTADALTTMALLALLALSLVVLTGLAGQVSLGQLAIAGLGGWAAARASNLWGWPFPVVAALGVVAAVASSLVFAVPSLRSRGSTLAVATLGLALAVQAVVFANPDLVGGFGGTRVEPPTLFGIDLRSAVNPQRYAAFVIVVLVLVALALVNLRAGRVGRRMLAIRSNERAAGSLGISVAGVKIAAFAIAAAVAGLGGVLMAFRFDAVVYTQFDVFASLNLVSFSVIGGIGYVGGAVVASFMAPGGAVSLLTRQVENLDRYLIMGAGVILVITLIQHPNGVADTLAQLGLRRRSRDRNPTRSAARRAGDRSAEIHPAAALDVAGLSVRFGAVQAVDGVHLRVEPGRIVGLIGPNGAGKTTLIDAVCGYVPTHAGAVRLGDHSLNGSSIRTRSRRGVGRCFQSVELFDDLTVRENLLVACESVPWHAWFLDVMRPRRDGLPARVETVVRQLKLDQLLDKVPPSLSYGDRKLVGVARALAAGPSVLLLDEPAAGLNNDDAAALAQTLRGIADDLGIGILLVEHDIDLVNAISDEIVVMEFGAVLARGAPDEVLADARVVSAYIGSAESSAASEELMA